VGRMLSGRSAIKARAVARGLEAVGSEWGVDLFRQKQSERIGRVPFGRGGAPKLDG